MANTASINLQNLDFNFNFATSYSIDIDKDFTREVDGNRAKSTTQTNIFSFTTFSTNSQIINVIPERGAVDIALPIVSITYDKSIFVGSGNFYLNNTSVGPILTLSTNDSRFTKTNNSISFDLRGERNIFVPLDQYYITSDNNLIKDIFGFTAQTLDLNNAVRFNYKDHAYITSVSPMYNSTGTYLPKLSITFDRIMTKNTNTNFYLNKEGSPDQIVLTIPTTSSNVLAVSTSTVRLDLSNYIDLFEGDQYYYLTNDFDNLRDQYLISNYITDGYLRFKYISAPILQSVIPAAGEVDIALPTVKLNYDRRLNKGTYSSSTVKIYKVGSPNQLVSTIPTTDSRISATNTTTAIINLSQDWAIFEGGEKYYITIDDKVYRDAETYLGTSIISTSTIRFTYKNNPSFISFTPNYISTTSLYASSLDIKFNRNMYKTSQDFYLKKIGSNDVKTLNDNNFSITTNTVNINLLNLSLNNSYYLEEGVYYIDSPKGFVIDEYHLPCSTLTQTLTSFSNELISYMSTASSRTYIANNQNLLFATNTPQILDPYTGTNLLYTISLSCANGEFASDNYASDKSSNWTYTGTKTSVNNKFSQIRFFPTKNYTSSTTISYSQSRDGVIQATRNINLLKATSGGISGGSGYQQILQFTGTQLWVPEYRYSKYGTADILVVGGGGCAALIYYTFGTSGSGGGGGGGGYQVLTNQQITSSSYAITIGAGGGSSSAGSPSSAFGITSGGGQPGTYAIQQLQGYPNYLYRITENGGSSGSPTIYSGASVTYTKGTSAYGAGGGGGGASGIGAVPIGYPPGTGGSIPTISGSGGAGGAGILSTFTNVTYAIGGQGVQRTSGNEASPNTGHGGNGDEQQYGTSFGASGIVVIRIYSL